MRVRATATRRRRVLLTPTLMMTTPGELHRKQTRRGRPHLSGRLVRRRIGQGLSSSWSSPCSRPSLCRASSLASLGASFLAITSFVCGQVFVDAINLLMRWSLRPSAAQCGWLEALRSDVSCWPALDCEGGNVRLLTLTGLQGVRVVHLQRRRRSQGLLQGLLCQREALRHHRRLVVVAWERERSESCAERPDSAGQR